MKKLVLLAVTAGSLLMSGATFAMSKSQENRLEDLCFAVKTDNRNYLAFKMKENQLSASQLVKGLVCNGEDAITFAQLHGAENTASMLSRRSGSVGKSVVIQDIAKNQLK